MAAFINSITYVQLVSFLFFFYHQEDKLLFFFSKKKKAHHLVEEGGRTGSTKEYCTCNEELLSYICIHECSV